MARICCLALLLVAVGGCYNWRDGVARAASLDHGCPAAQVHVTDDNGHDDARIVVLDVCGARRVYRDVNANAGAYVWVDGTGGDLGPVTRDGARLDGTAVVGRGVGPVDSAGPDTQHQPAEEP